MSEAALKQHWQTAPRFHTGREAMDAPLKLPLADGGSLQIKIDALLLINGICFVGGWLSEDATLEIDCGGEILPLLCAGKFPRPDVSRHLGTSTARNYGFGLCARVRGNAQTNLLVNGKDKLHLPDAIAGTRPDPAHEGVLGRDVYAWAEAEYQNCNPKIAEIPASSPIKCQIEHALCWPDAASGCPVLVYGWLCAPDGVEILAKSGEQMLAPEICWLPRPDVLQNNDLFLNAKREGCGFVFIFKNLAGDSQTISLIIKDGCQLYKCADANINNIYNYRRFLREIFSLPIYSSMLGRVCANILIPLLKPLQKRRQAQIMAARHEAGHIGKLPEKPDASIIIPLYGSLEYLEAQIASLVKDRACGSRAEIIYVVDDPNIYDSFRQIIPHLAGKYATALRWIASPASQGFSGANNLGASLAQGKYFIFMNSDALPKKEGWLNAFIEFLEFNPDAGIAGCQLLHGGGTIQHCGVEFVPDAAMGIWNCVHTRQGQRPGFEENEVVYPAAVTGACVAMRREDFNNIGGWNVEYLIGGYEDMDLCLKIQKAGKRITCLPRIEMFHYCHKSFDCLEDGPWLQRIAYYNGVLFRNKWNEWLLDRKYACGR